MIIKTSYITQLVLLFSISINKINSACVKLTNSKSCPGFTNYFIDTTNGKFPLNGTTTPHYTDVNSFDSYIERYAKFLPKYFVKELTEGSTCNNQQKSQIETYATANLRYLTTFACNFILISKENKCQNTRPKVCKNTCNEFLNSYQNLIKNFNNLNCLNKNTVSKYVSKHTDRCTLSDSNFSASTSCIDSKNESYCGFTTEADASTYCKSSNEECCKSLSNANNLTQKLNEGNNAQSLSAKVANVNETPNKETNDSNNTEKDNSKLWMIVIGACTLLFVGAIVYFYKKGESLDTNSNSYYNENKKFPPYQSPRAVNTSGYSSSPSYGMNNGNKSNFDSGEVLINRTEMKNINDEPINDFDFGGNANNYNFTSNVSNINNNGFNNAALFTGAGATAMGGAAAYTGATMNNKTEEVPKPQLVNITNIEPPEDTKLPLIKIDDEPMPQIVNMTNIQPPESQDRNETDRPITEYKGDEEPKAQMVNMTEIPEPEVQQNRNTKFLSTYSEAPDNQRISSQFYGDSEMSYDFSSSKLNIPSQLDNKTLSLASSARMSSATDRELNSTPYRAVHTYEPQLNDELLLEINDIVEVVYIYDDGWVWGINTRTNESGACPMLCLEKVDGENEGDYSKSIISGRDSMISRDSVPGRRDSRILKVDGINK